MLSAFLSKKIKENNPVNTESVLSVFLNEDSAHLWTADGVLRNFLAQLLKQDPSVIFHFPTKDGNREISWDFELLWQVFEKIAKIAGLDQCVS